ncbi:MAG: condensation domain-containing protein [Bacteroidota bacterium]
MGGIAAHIHRDKINVMHATPTLWREVLKAEAQSLRSLCCISSGGEKLSAALASQLSGSLKQDVYNLYGPTETCINAAGYRVIGFDTDPPIGRPLPNVELYILDDDLNLMPMGAVGEICVSGVGLADGYIDDKLTSRRFVDNPYNNNFKLYRTGDLGRWTASGEIVYLGRKDAQVKINGYRLELAAVESTIRQIEGIDEVIVFTQSGSDNRDELVSYYTGRADRKLIRETLSEELPYYMIPSVIVKVAHVPMLPSGKVDRVALRNLASSGASGDLVLPTTPTQQMLVATLQALLQVEAISIHHDFFQIGGNSIKAIKLAHEIKKLWKVTIGLRDIFKFPVIEKLAEMIDLGTCEPAEPVFITALPAAEGYDLSYGQQRQWIVDQNPLEHKAYTMSGLLQIDGPLNSELVCRVFEILVHRHESLRTTFGFGHGRLQQRITPACDASFIMSKVDLQGSSDIDVVMTKTIQDLEDSGFDLQNGPLVKVLLFQLSPSSYRLFISLDHIISDGWSMQVLIREFMILYESLQHGRTSPLPNLEIHYKDFAHWQNQKLNDPAQLTQWKTFWTSEFSGALPVIDLPTSFVRPKQKSFKGAVVRSSFEGETFQRIKAYCRDKQITPYVFFLAALNHFLHRITGQTDLIVGTGASGRTHPVLQDQVGLYANIIPIRTRWMAWPDFDTLVLQTKHKVIECLHHQEYPFLKLLEDLDLSWEKNRSPLFDVMLMVQESSVEKFRIEGLQISEVDLPTQSSLFDMYFNIVEHHQAFDIFINYDTALFAKADAGYLHQEFIDVIVRAVDLSGQQYFSTSRKVQPRLNSAVIFNDHLQVTRPAEVGRVFIPVDAIHHNDAETFGVAVEINGTEYIETTMLGRYRFDGNLEILSANPDFLTADETWWSTREFESSICTLGHLRDCKLINQLVHGVRETVVHLASQHFTDDDILREKLAESLPLSVVKKLIFNDVPLLPYLPDGTVDIESLATMPLLSNRMASELNHVPEIDSSIEKVTVLAVNRALEPLPIHLQDVQSTHAIRIATDKPLTGSGGANMTNGDPAYVHGGILQKEGQACSLQEALIHIASAQPEKGIYIVDNANEDVFLSYPELLEQASSIAGGLRGAGLKPRSPVLLQFNRLQNIFSAFWGCLMGDFIPVIVARPDSFDKKGMVLDKVHSAWSLLKKPCIVTDEPDGVENMAQVYEDEAGLFVLDIRNLLEESNPYYLEKAAPHDVAFYQLTSGSTGASKCIPETHIAIIEHVLGAKSFNQLDASNISLNWMPMDHVGAILTYHIKSVYLGADQVQMRTELVLENPLLWLSYLDKYKVTHTWSPNFGYRLVVNALKENEHPKYDLSSMRHFLNGGEQVTMGVVKEFLELTEDFTLGRYCIQPAFGMAEVATAFIYNNSFSEQSILWIKNESLNDLLEIRSHEDEHCTSFIELGPPVPGVEIRITDEENRVLPERKIGRFQIRGNSVMPGYLNNEKANAESFVGDGWFNSGDLGFIHNGKLTITGREKEMIIIRGNNFYCFEIEDFVGKIEGVTPTYVAACSLKQESSDTEGFTIFYVPSSENEFLDFELMERIRLAVAFNFKINPEYVIPCDKTSFPKTTSGKIQRARLQKIFHDGGFNDIVKQIDLKFRNEKTILPNWFYEKVWIRKNLPCTPRRIDGKTLLLFLNDDQQIRWWRTKYALDAVFVKPAQAFSREAADVFAVRPACKDDYIVMFGQLQASVKFVTHIVHAWNFNEVENSFAEMILEKDFDRGIFSVLNCLQAQSLSHETKFLVVTSGGMAVRSTDQLHAGKGTLPGFIKSAARESSQIKFCQLDISYPDAAWPEKVYHELFNPHQDGEVAYRQEKRYISRLRQYVPTSHQHEHPIRFDRGGLYLIAGGLGRIGQKIAAHLIGKFNARLLLVGCTDIHQQSDDPKIIARRKAYDALKKLSPDVAYESIDLRDTQNLCSWIEKMEMQKNTKLSGILHVAGVVEDIDIHLQDINKNLFVNLSREDVLKMYQAKVFGTCSLLRLMPARPQAMFVTFSSALSYFGGASASAYASAGSFQDALMLNYKKHYPNIQTINWTQWNTSGVADAGSELIQQKGFVAISHQQALKSLTVSLNSGKAQMLVGPDLKNEQILSEIDGAAIKKELRVYYTSKNHSSDETREQLSAIVATYQPASGRRFELQIIEEQNLPVDERDRVIKVDLYLKRNLQSSSKAIHPQTAIQKVISAIWRSVLGLEQLDITTSFFAVGGDSLKATQILARIRQNLHVQIELKDIFENPSILKLSHVI